MKVPIFPSYFSHTLRDVIDMKKPGRGCGEVVMLADLVRTVHVAVVLIKFRGCAGRVR